MEDKYYKNNCKNKQSKPNLYKGQKETIKNIKTRVQGVPTNQVRSTTGAQDTRERVGTHTHDMKELLQQQTHSYKDRKNAIRFNAKAYTSAYTCQEQ